MAKVLLAKARFTGLEQSAMTPPVGLLYVAAALREYGHQVRVFESGGDWRDTRSFVDALRSFRPDVVGIGGLTQQSVSIRLLADAAKATLPEVPVVVGGPHPTSYPLRSVSYPSIDYAVRGEGEVAFPALVGALVHGGRDPRKIPGVVYLARDGSLGSGGDPQLIRDLDALPVPAYDLLDLGFYERRASMAHVGRRRYLPLVTSRGCPYRCIYCHQNHGKQFRARSPRNVLREVEAAYRRFGVRDFEIYDDSFNLNRPRMEALLDGFAALEHKVDLHFPNGVRTDLMVESDFVRLRRAGTRFIAVAVETASGRLQKLIQKNLDLDRVFANIEAADRAGLFVNGFFMLGFPTETYAEARATVDFAVRSRLHEALFFIVTPFKGTPLYEMVSDRLHASDRVTSDVDMDYFRGHCNVSAMTDRELFGLQREANLRFYLDPGRAARVFARHPRRAGLVRYGFQSMLKMIPHPRSYAPKLRSIGAVTAARDPRRRQAGVR